MTWNKDNRTQKLQSASFVLHEKITIQNNKNTEATNRNSGNKIFIKLFMKKNFNKTVQLHLNGNGKLKKTINTNERTYKAIFWIKNWFCMPLKDATYTVSHNC